MINHWQIINGDCLSTLRSMETATIDLIVTSPPYADRRKKIYGGVAADHYVSWFMPIVVELYRVLKPTGSFILNIKEHTIGGERSTYVMELVIEFRRHGWKWIEEYCWHKKNSAPGKWPTRFRDGWERLFHFTKSLDFAMYQDAVMVPASEATKTRVKKLSARDQMRVESSSGSGIGRCRSKWAGRDLVYPDNVLFLPAEYGGIKHSAPYPISLPSFFIKLFTAPGNVVLDPFVGSGTTVIAATRLGRAGIGIDLDPVSCEYARQRIIDDLPLFNSPAVAVAG